MYYCEEHKSIAMSSDISSSGEGQSLMLLPKYKSFSDVGAESATKVRKLSAGRKSPVMSIRKSDLTTLLDEKFQQFILPINNQLTKIEESLCYQKLAETESRLLALEEENKMLKERLNDMDTKSRKNNIRFYGLAEDKNEDCEGVLMGRLRGFFPSFDNRTFETVYRVGQYRHGMIRPILCRVVNYKDKLKILSKRTELAQRSIRLGEDFSRDVEENRKTLLPAFKEGRSLGLNIKLNGDKLFLDKKTYNCNNVRELPEILHPENTSTKSNNNITAFYSSQSPLSNFYPSVFQVEDQTFTCAEQYLTIVKARRFGDEEKVNQLLNCNSPSKMKFLAKSIKGYNHTTWRNECQDLVYQGILQKFKQSDNLTDFLLQTGDSLIVEASLDKSWGVGIRMNNRDIWDEKKHNGDNRLGKILMKVREELKPKML